jgi:hypothetical protein
MGGKRAGELFEDIAVVRGSPIIVGATASLDFPVTEDALQLEFAAGSIFNGALAKVSPDGRVQTYGSYLGGDGFDEIKLISIRKSIHPAFRSTDLFIAGQTRSSSIHVTDPGARGLSDVFISRWEYKARFVLQP